MWNINLLIEKEVETAGSFWFDRHMTLYKVHYLGG